MLATVCNGRLILSAMRTCRALLRVRIDVVMIFCLEIYYWCVLVRVLFFFFKKKEKRVFAGVFSKKTTIAIQKFTVMDDNDIPPIWEACSKPLIWKNNRLFLARGFGSLDGLRRRDGQKERRRPIVNSYSGSS